ncbi:MAG TPA: hypothetical protein VG944_10615 [Fimbriimonas sp.]|nr:hypothetical protein [Fimbriimonas sp.]
MKGLPDFSMAEPALLTQDDPRLGKARELAEYLKQNPKAAKRDPEELAGQFGVSPNLVRQLTSSRFLNEEPEPRHRERVSLRERLKKVGTAGTRLLGALTANAYLYLLACAGAFLVVDVVPHSKVAIERAVVVWLAAQALCHYMRPQYRYVAFAAALNAVALVRWIFGEAVSTEAPFNTLAGRASISLFAGVVIAIFGSAVMSIFLVLGGAHVVRANRRREAARSRHDLLGRMYELEERLRNLPPPKPVKAQHGLLSFLRARLFLSSLLLALVLGGLRAINLAIVSPDAIERATRRQPADGHVHVTGFASVPPIYLLFSLLAFVLGFGGPILLGILASTPRKTGVILAGFVVGEVLSTAVAWPFGMAKLPTQWVLWQGISAVAIRMGVVLATRFGLYFHQSLTSLSRDAQGDESAIVSELLEIRHRLSANPVSVFVLVVDAAGSTKMKEGEDPLMVEYSFRSYQAWISETVGRLGGKVDAMTGDGAICAFGTAEAALKAAKELHATTAKMNEHGNRLRMPFRLRIALHGGQVVADLDKVQFTNVIDVAAHVEKFSPVGGMALTAPFAHSLAGLTGLEKTATVDGIDVYAIANRS